MRHFQRHQLSRNTLLLWMVFEKILKDFRAGKAVPSNFRAPISKHEVLRAGPKEFP